MGIQYIRLLNRKNRVGISSSRSTHDLADGVQLIWSPTIWIISKFWWYDPFNCKHVHFAHHLDRLKILVKVCAGLPQGTHAIPFILAIFSRWSNRQTPIVFGRPDRQQGMPIHVESQAPNNLVGAIIWSITPLVSISHFGWFIEYPNIIPSLPVKLNELMLQGNPGVGAIVSNLLMLLI